MVKLVNYNGNNYTISFEEIYKQPQEQEEEIYKQSQEQEELIFKWYECKWYELTLLKINNEDIEPQSAQMCIFKTNFNNQIKMSLKDLISRAFYYNNYQEDLKNKDLSIDKRIENWDGNLDII